MDKKNRGRTNNTLPGKQFVKLDTDEYARGDQLSRVRSFQVAVSTGIMTPNEARAKMDLEPYEGGDKFYIGLQVHWLIQL